MLYSVSTLVLMVTGDQKKTFEEMIKCQIKKLRKQLDKVPSAGAIASRRLELASSSPAPLPPKPDFWEMARSRMAYTLGRSERSERTLLTY